LAFIKFDFIIVVIVVFVVDCRTAANFEHVNKKAIKKEENENSSILFWHNKYKIAFYSHAHNAHN